jgi:hypothetical protein
MERWTFPPSDLPPGEPVMSNSPKVQEVAQQIYAEKSKRDVLSVCTELLDRACAAVALILSTADQLQQDHEAA